MTRMQIAKGARRQSGPFSRIEDAVEAIGAGSGGAGGMLDAKSRSRIWKSVKFTFVSAFRSPCDIRLDRPKLA